MSLLRVELSRLRARRAVVLLLVAAALLTALVAATTVWDTRPVGAEERREAAASAEQLRQEPGIAEELDACREDPEQFFGAAATSEECEQLVPSAADFLDRTPLSLTEEVGDSGLVVLVVTAALLALAGTTYAGADWNTGSMSNQLLFSPRRGRVWLAKAAAVTALGGVFTAVVVGAFWTTLWAVAVSRGIDVSPEVAAQLVGTSARGVALGAATSLGGYALTMLLRSTVASLAVMFGYATGGEALLAFVPIPEAGRASLTFNVLAWLQRSTPVYDRTIECPPTEGGCSQVFILTAADAAAYLGAVLVVLSLMSLLLFRRRDVP